MVVGTGQNSSAVAVHLIAIATDDSSVRFDAIVAFFGIGDAAAKYCYW